MLFSHHPALNSGTQLGNMPCGCLIVIIHPIFQDAPKVTHNNNSLYYVTYTMVNPPSGMLPMRMQLHRHSWPPWLSPCVMVYGKSSITNVTDEDLALPESHAKYIFPDQSIGLKSEELLQCYIKAEELLQCYIKPEYIKSEDLARA